MHALPRCLVALLAAASMTACVQKNDLDLLELRVYQQEQQVQKLNDRLGRTTKELEASRPEQADMWSDVQSMRTRLVTIESLLEDMQQRSMVAEDSRTNFIKQLTELQQHTQYLDAGLRTVASQLAIDLPERPRPQTPAPLPATGNGTVPADTSAPVATPGNGTVPAVPSATNSTVPGPKAAMVAPDGTELVINGGKGASSATPAPKTPAPADAAKQETPAVTEQALYDAAHTAFMERRYSDGLRMWEEFEKIYPKHELTANAVFWQGESHYQLKAYAPAVLAYQKIIDKYPKSDKLRAAMLKQGICFMKLGKNTAAKVRLEELIKKYPKSAEAERAKKTLTEIK